MQACDLMTRDVVSVAPTASIRDVARLLLAHHVSAAPVIDASGTLLGMVSEGDLIGRSEPEREARRDWWLTLLSEGETLNADFVASLRHPERTARDVMSAPVIEVTEATEASEIAALLAQYRIKRVPVVRDGRVVGIVSRADLLRALAGDAAPGAVPEHVAHTRGLIAEALATLDDHFFGRHGEASGRAAVGPPHAIAEGGLSVADFRSLMAGFEHRRSELAAAARHAAADRQSARTKQLIDEHVRGEAWNSLLHRAREAAEHGAKEFQLLRFPSDLCSDGGRAINSGLPDWPHTLRGEAAEIYLRWERELRPRGFHLSARVLDFPRGMPGDIGLFLGWGE
ncbi:MAG TPA: CBS domain-containing protein [Stellaceae bacterium]|nr:CBS domain-containing protein [Stellaceae bacterium]